METVNVKSTPARTRPSARRQRSTTAELASEGFAELRTFFVNDSQLHQALGWSAPTFRRWLGGWSPARPRTASSERIAQLLVVARAGAQWVADPHDVGRWLLTFNPGLGEERPARIVHELGWEGAALLVSKMAFIAPREQAAREFAASPERLREMLRTLGAPTPPTVAEEAVFSDFASESRAELASTARRRLMSERAHAKT